MTHYTRADMSEGGTVCETIRTQRAVRRFDGRPIDEETLLRIVDAGRHAPSSMNEQRWAFVAITDRDRLRQLSRAGEYAGHIAGAAAAVALVTPEADEGWRRESIAFDLGQAAQSMMLCAWSEGIGSVHAALHDDGLARQLLAYPEGWRCDYVLSFGYPAERPWREGKRRSLEDVLHRERW
jgi:nitroreductase